MDYPTPPIAWLNLTPYMHQWLVNECGGAVKLHGKTVLSVFHLKGVKPLMRMQTQNDVMDDANTMWSLSAMRMDFLQQGISLGLTGRGGLELTNEQLAAFMPIECPPVCLTKHGVLRPWTRQTSFGAKQARELVTLLRSEFWKAVREYHRHFKWPNGEPHTAIAMTESFCQDTGTPDIYAEDLRREWQRQQKAGKK